MSYKIYKLGAYVVIEDVANGTTKEFNSTNVQVIKTKTDVTLYSVLNDGLAVLSNIGLASILDANGVAYVEADWDVFRYEQTGSVNSSEVSNPYPAPSTTTVNISSAQILTMGTTPITLLPASGVGMYYDVEKVIFEYTYATTAYTYPIGDFPYVAGPSGGQLALKELLTLTQNYVATSRALNPIDAINGAIVAVIDELNQGVYLTMWDGGDPTLGDGTMRAIITYTVRTFGA